MNILFENDYVIAQVDDENSLYYYEWRPITEKMTPNLYLNTADKLLEIFIDSKCEKGLVNALNMRFTIAPYLQVKIGDKLFIHLNKQLIKFAHVIPESLYSSLSHEQLWEDNKEKNYEEKYFSHLAEALTWILKN